MYKLDSSKQCLLKDILLENLKLLGVRSRLPKKLKENEKENIYFPECQIFQKPLHLLKMCSVHRLNGTAIEIPEFLADACAVIERGIQTEGIFRKAGSTSKQRESKILINQGKKVNTDYHVFDACSLVKLFFRELPQPLIPYIYQDIILSCLLLSSYEKQVEALMLVCLLLPLENLKTLAFFMEFLLKVSRYSELNKMSKKNLAIILTPTLMPAQKGRASNSYTLDIAHHFKVLEILIEHSEKIGVLPDYIERTLLNEKLKKKKRSGSLTRMLTGLKKIVGNKGPNTPDWDESSVSTPNSLNSNRKRKKSENNGVSDLLAKKKFIASVLTDGELLATPMRCRMHGYVTPGFPSTDSVVPPNLKKADSGNSPYQTRSQFRNIRDESNKTSASNIVKRCLTKKQKSMSTTGSSSSIGNLFNLGHSKASLDPGLSVMSWCRKKTRSNLFLNKSENDYHRNNNLEDTVHSDNSTDSTDDSELITVHKTEYEDIKNRVLALEEEIEILNAVHSVQNVYERTLEESEKINNTTSDHLARKLNKELKIRRSSESKIIRSPSARKIGSIRRRSKESLQKSVEHKTSLRRGRPNTLQSGLPSPGNRRLFNNSEISDYRSDSSFQESTNAQTEWQSGDKFFARDYLLQKLIPVPQGRPSIVEIRNQNAGMVLEKAKLFNALTETGKDEEVEVQKRQSVRLENLRKMKEIEVLKKKQLSRTGSLGCNNSKDLTQLKSSEIRNALRKNVSSQSLKRNLAFDSPPSFCIKKKTPSANSAKTEQNEAESTKRVTPTMKKSLNTRSPRTLLKTPLNQLKTGARSRATPVRVLLDPYGTPRVGVRRSPRILARALTSSPKIKD